MTRDVLVATALTVIAVAVPVAWRAERRRHTRALAAGKAAYARTKLQRTLDAHNIAEAIRGDPAAGLAWGPLVYHAKFITREYVFMECGCVLFTLSDPPEWLLCPACDAIAEVEAKRT